MVWVGRISGNQVGWIVGASLGLCAKDRGTGFVGEKRGDQRGASAGWGGGLMLQGTVFLHSPRFPREMESAGWHGVLKLLVLKQLSDDMVQIGSPELVLSVGQNSF